MYVANWRLGSLWTFKNEDHDCECSMVIVIRANKRTQPKKNDEIQGRRGGKKIVLRKSVFSPECAGKSTCDLVGLRVST